jgi:hypothetical protein
MYGGVTGKASDGLPMSILNRHEKAQKAQLSGIIEGSLKKTNLCFVCPFVAMS